MEPTVPNHKVFQWIAEKPLVFHQKRNKTEQKAVCSQIISRSMKFKKSQASIQNMAQSMPLTWIAYMIMVFSMIDLVATNRIPLNW